MLDLLRILLTLYIGFAVYMLVWSVFRYPLPTEPSVHRRIAVAMGMGRRQTVFEQPVLAPIMSMALGIARRFNLQPVRDRIRRNLSASGNPNGYSVEEYLAICLVGAMGAAAASGMLELLTFSRFLLLVVPMAAALGFAVPMTALSGAAARRVTRIAKRLPYTMDLIALTMAAGSTFPEAIDTIIRDDPADDLNQELAVVQAEIGFGTSRAGALLNMAQRIPLETLRSIVGAINQAETLGTPLSQILKVQSTMLRMNRSVRAEKLSASASLRILIPSMLILLAVVIVVFSPFIIRRWQSGTWW